MNEIRDPNWMTHLWQRVKSLFSGLDARVTALEQGGGGGGGAVSGVKGDAESTYRTGAVNLTAANIGAKAVQAAVNDPTASGTSLTFIDTISQDAQGVITPTKKTVSSASQSADGLMSSTDKTKLDGIASGAQVNTITGVKGNAESSYRTGNVNLTAANLGLNLDFDIYNTVADLGLTAGSATILAAFNAMSTNTILICSGGEFASGEVPTSYGTVEIVKPSNAARSYVRFYGKATSDHDWRMYLGATTYNGNNSDSPTGYWHPEFTSFVGGRGAAGSAARGTSLSITFLKNTVHFLMVGNSSTSRAYVGLVSINNSGGVSAIDLYKGSNVTLSNASYTLTLGFNSTDDCSFVCIPGRGEFYTGFSVT